MKEPVGKKAIQSLISNTQSTHNLGAQATAARFLRLLRERYIGTKALPAGFDSAKTQTLLLEFIGVHLVSLANKKDVTIATAKREALKVACPQTLEVIERLLAYAQSPTETMNNTTTHNVFLQLKAFINRHPGMDGWNDDHERWSINVIYDAHKQDYDTVSASPAETLHLCCAALLDDTHWVSSASSDMSTAQQPNTSEEETLRAVASSSRQGAASSSSYAASSNESTNTSAAPGIAERIRGLYLLLLDKQLEKVAKQRTLCATGQQHALLMGLHARYLDEEGQPCEAVFSIETAINNLFNVYLDDQLASLSFNARLAWLARQRQGSDEQGPVIAFLTEQAAKHGSKASWETQLRGFLNTNCLEFGLNPAHPEVEKAIKEQLDNFAYKTLPLAQSAKEQLQVEVLNLVPQHKVIDSVTEQLLQLGRNLVIQSIQEKIQTAALIPMAVLRGVLTADDDLKRLQAYPKSMLICGEDEASFKASRETLAYEILVYYQALLNTGMRVNVTDGLQAAKKDLNAKETGFKDKLHTEITVNFFACLPKDLTYVDTRFLEAWQRIQSLGANSERHPSILTDEMLAAWESNNQEVVFLQEGDGRIRVLEERLYVSTYQVNRMLLHALLVKPGEWSESFKRNLSRLLRWLLQPVTDEDGPALTGLKRSYPRYLLPNLYSRLLIVQVGLDEKVEKFIATALNKPAINLNALCSLRLFYFIFGVPFEPEEVLLFNTVIGRLTMVINSGHELALFLNNNSMLNSQRQLILDAVKPKLSDWIQNFTQLCNLLFDKCLSNTHRTFLLSTMKDKLGSIIGSVNDFNILFDNSKLEETHRRLIWDAIKDSLEGWMGSAKQFSELFGNSKLNDTQRQFVWNKVKDKDKLESLMQDEGQRHSIVNLQLSCVLRNTYLTDEQRQNVLDAVKDTLWSCCGNLSGLYYYLECDTLSGAQRQFILNAVKDELVDYVSDVTDINYLLGNEHLSDQNRQFILNTLENKLKGLCDTRKDLCNLLANKHLTDKHRQFILTAVKNKLGDLIYNPNELYLLFCRSKLNSAHKQWILEALCGNGSDRMEFFSDCTLSEAQIQLFSQSSENESSSVTLSNQGLFATPLAASSSSCTASVNSPSAPSH